MKKIRSSRSTRKLTLTTETIRHLKDLTTRQLGHVHGASGPCTGDGDCTTTRDDPNI